MPEKYIIIQSVARAAALLEHVAGSGKNTGITAIAAHVGLHKSTCFGLLNTLQHLGYVVQDKETGRYSLGIKTFQLGQAYTANLDIRKLAQPQLAALAEKSCETVRLVLREGLHVVYIDKIEAPHAVSISSRIGQRARLHCTGVGKVILAHMAPEDQKHALEGALEPSTKYTITDKETLFDHLNIVRQQGFGFADQEAEIGMRCLAAPIFDSEGNVPAAISISGPAARLTEEWIQVLLPCLRESVADISRRLGYMPLPE